MKKTTTRFVQGQVVTAAMFNEIFERLNQCEVRDELREQREAMPTGVIGAMAGLLAVSGAATARPTRRGFLGLSWFDKR